LSHKKLFKFVRITSIIEPKIMINQSAILDLVRLTHEINDRVESLELMGDEKFMASFRKAKEQIKKRDFTDWNAL
jgi:hypothetical protein